MNVAQRSGQSAAQPREAAPKIVVLHPRAPQIVLRELPRDPRALDTVRGYLEWLWSFKACRICGALGACAHRDPDVDIARAEGWFSYLKELER